MGGACSSQPKDELIQAASVADEDAVGEQRKSNMSKSSKEDGNSTDLSSSSISPTMHEEQVPVEPALRDRSSLELNLEVVQPGGTRISSLRKSLKKHSSKDNTPVQPQTEAAPETKTRRLSRSTHHPLAHEHVRDVVTHILGQKKDQDRAICVPALLPGVLYCGVFDGHGRDGETRSELATTELPKLIKRELAKVLDEGRPLKEKDLHDALDVSYAEFHEQLDKLYEDTVYKRAVEEANIRQKMVSGEEGDGDAVPARMPQDGGTTATSVIVSGELIVVGWVGDSRAVLARRIAKKRGPILNRFSSRLKISTLTEDHNVAANLDEEMQRVQDQGGEIYGKHLAAGAVEGMLQLTRSLGDSPFHRTGLVVSKPGIITIPVVDESVDPLLFLLVASDGLWDHFSNKEALSFVYKRLKKDGYADEKSESKRSALLTDTARALEHEAIKRSNDRRSHSDDITVLLITFTRGWGIEAEDSPSF